MGQLFDRVSRIVRAELNAKKGNEDNYLNNKDRCLNEGTALAGEAIAGVAIVPLTALEALTGADLYEALRSILQNNHSSKDAAVMGAATGVATSTMISGVGMTADGGVANSGMPLMVTGRTAVDLELVSLNRLLQKGIDPEKLLNTAIEQMESDLQKMRKPVIDFATAQKPRQEYYKKVQAEADEWKKRAQLALIEGNEPLAKQALHQKWEYTQILKSLQTELNHEPDSIKSIKQDVKLLESKISEAKMMRASLEALITNITAYFAHSSASNLCAQVSEVDAELEALKQQIDQL